MFTTLSGIRTNSATRSHLPYMGTISRNSRASAGCTGSIGSAGKVQILEIVLMGVDNVYKPGQDVIGKIIVDCAGTLRFRSLSVSMRGVAKCGWIESKPIVVKGAPATDKFNAEIEYFNRKKILIGSDGEKQTLLDGRHEFDFRFRLPDSPDIATSFEGKLGNIRYYVKAELDQSWSSVYRTKKAFTVIAPIDINRVVYSNPVERTSDKTVGCWVCTAGEIGLTASTDRKGYCPGESVSIRASFSNSSSRRVVPSATLIQWQTFTAGGKTRREPVRYTSLTGRAIPAGTEDEWDVQLLKIPPVSPTVDNCQLIAVEYQIRISLNLKSWIGGLAVVLPIVVGTVPHRRPQQLPAYDAAFAPEAPPPSYVECVGAGAFDEDEDEEERFVPRVRYVESPPAYAIEDPFPPTQAPSSEYAVID